MVGRKIPSVMVVPTTIISVHISIPSIVDWPPIIVLVFVSHSPIVSSTPVVVVVSSWRTMISFESPFEPIRPVIIWVPPLIVVLLIPVSIEVGIIALIRR